MSTWDTFNFLAIKVLKIVYINFLWLLFSAIGLVVFTFFPATTALFSTTKKLMIDKEDFKIFSEFWKVFRSNYLVSNGFGIIFIGIGSLFYVDYIFLSMHPKLQFFLPLLALFMLLGLFTFLFFFPVYLYYELPFFQYFKQAFLIVITSPIEVLLLAIISIVFYLVAEMLPGFVPLMAGSTFAYFSLLICHRSFKRIEKLKE